MPESSEGLLKDPVCSPKFFRRVPINQVTLPEVMEGYPNLWEGVPDVLMATRLDREPIRELMASCLPIKSPQTDFGQTPVKSSMLEIRDRRRFS